MTDTLIYDSETRDLMNLVRKRQSEVIMSVAQLARDRAQAYAIFQAAATAAIGGACGAYAAWQRCAVDDPLDLAEAVIALMREVKDQP